MEDDSEGKGRSHQEVDGEQDRGEEMQTLVLVWWIGKGSHFQSDGVG